MRISDSYMYLFPVKDFQFSTEVPYRPEREKHRRDQLGESRHYPCGIMKAAVDPVLIQASETRNLIP